MTTHSIFYYPYASFMSDQSPLLKVAAIYFDKLYILDPEKSTSGIIGIEEPEVAKDVALLEHKDVEILERIAPEEVVEKYEPAIAKAVRDDLRDKEFVEHCATSDKDHWTIALAKIPKDIREDPKFQPKDKAMQRLMGEVPRDAVDGASRFYDEMYMERMQSVYSEQSVYDETVIGPTKEIEFRYADYPIEIGESIMMNHALFAGLLHSNATPLTDDPFHHKALEIKIKRARQIPELAKLLDDVQRADQIRQDLLVARAVTDRQLELPIIAADQPLEKILEYREKNKDSLDETRKQLAWLAREIRETPWTTEFDEEIYRNIIPQKIRPLLEDTKKARNSWLKLAGMALATTAATAQLFVNPVPMISIPMFLGVLSLAGEDVIPGVEELLNWREQQSSMQKSGLHYFLNYKATN